MQVVRVVERMSYRFRFLQAFGLMILAGGLRIKQYSISPASTVKDGLSWWIWAALINCVLEPSNLSLH